MIRGEAPAVPALETERGRDEVIRTALASSLPSELGSLCVSDRMEGSDKALIEPIRERVVHCQGPFTV